MAELKFDFSGYATKHGLKCSDGRTILKDAFKHQDGKTVPLVWQHLHDDPGNILGHAILENRDDGVYCYGKFNSTEAGSKARELVTHGDISSLSIYANQLQEKAKQVMHGAIREVSLVLSGANPGATIDNLSFAHTDGSFTDAEDEALISFGIKLAHANDGESNEDDEGEDDKKTVADVFETLTEEQKTVVYAMIAQALGDSESKPAEKDDKSAQHSDEDDLDHSNKEGANIMKHNVFDQTAQTPEKNVLTHDQLMNIVQGAKKHGSLKDSFIAHAEDYGFDPIDILFPDARYTNTNGPEIIKRDDTWVSTLLNEATHTPFSRIKTGVADITADEARAKGYVTGSLKKEEIIPLMKRVTLPTTIYKKQKLDRDDMVDITDFDVVIWLKREMRGMLDEELARAILIGDGRDVSDEDKINEQNIRPIALDNDSVYVHRIAMDNDVKTDAVIDDAIRARKFYKGSGVPTLYTSTDLLTEMLLVKDAMGRRLYANVTELASVLRVSKIVEVELLNEAFRKVSDTQANQILGIIVNMKDYTIGADKGGQVAMFDDFDIDYNQYKYLIETRVSGALTRPKSAVVLEKLPASDEPEG